MANKNSEAIVALVKTNPGKYSINDISSKYDMSYDEVRGVLRYNNLIGLLKKENSNNHSNFTPEQQTEYYRKVFKDNGLSFDDYPYLWDKETIKGMSLFYRNPEYTKKEKDTRDDFLKAIKASAPKVTAKRLKTGKLIIPANFDIHIGKHCEMIRSGNDYTPEIAVKRVLEGQEALYQLTKVFDVTDVLLPLGNDVVHVDNNRYTTTSGTPQDSYGSLESQILLAANLYIRSIEKFAENHNVWLAHVPSNHDRVSGWTVSQIVAARFHNHPRVRWTNDTLSQHPRKYFIFGDNLIMFEHGETKEESVVGTVMHDVRQALAETKYTYVYRGHLHHKQVSSRGATTEKQLEKDLNGATVIKSGGNHQNRVKVEVMRSPSPADAWHALSGYSNIPAVEMFVHCPEEGQIARFTKMF